MSGGEQKSLPSRGVELLVLAVLVGLMVLAIRATPHGHGTSALAALGFLLLAGTVVASVLEIVGIPHLTAYLLAGMAAGPYALGLVDHQAVTDLSPINALALSLIALAGGHSRPAHLEEQRAGVVAGRVRHLLPGCGRLAALLDAGSACVG